MTSKLLFLFGVVLVALEIAASGATTNRFNFWQYKSTGTNGGGGGGNGLLNNLVAVWEMEAADASNQTDATGNGRTLTQHGSPTRSGTHIEGSFSTSTGGSIYYDSSNAAFNGTGSFSLTMWVNGNGSQIDGDFAATRWNVGHAWGVYIVAGVATFYVRNAGDSLNFSAASTVTMGASGWHLIAVTYNSSTKIAKISVDGETLVSSATTDGLNTVSENFTLSALSGGGTGLSALVDETAFWSTDLSQTQINTLWASGAGFFYSGGGWTN